MARRRKTSTRRRPRERVKYKTHSRYMRRDKRGRFTKDQVSVGRSLKADRRKKAKRTVRPGYGDQGDQRRRKRGR